jgi:hypothetical protein
MDANKMGEYVEWLVRYLEPSLRRKAFLTVVDVSGALEARLVRRAVGRSSPDGPGEGTP